MNQSAGEEQRDTRKSYRYHVQRVKTAAGQDLTDLMQRHRLSWLGPVIKAFQQAEQNAARPGADPAGSPDDWRKVSEAARIAAEHCKTGRNARESHRAASHTLWVIIRNAHLAVKIAEEPDTEWKS